MLFLLLLQKHTLGSVLMEHVFYHLDIIEKDCFGLQFSDHYNVNVSYLFCALCIVLFIMHDFIHVLYIISTPYIYIYMSYMNTYFIKQI